MAIIIKETIKFLKIRSVKSPTRAHEFDAGIDFFVPEFFAIFLKDLEDKNPLIFKTAPGEDFVKKDEGDKLYFLLNPGLRVMIPSGIKSRMAHPGRALIANNKSGVATKHGLVFGASVVDYTYKGEIHLSLINTSLEPVRIYENMKILQFLETPVFINEIEMFESSFVSESTFYEGLQDDRGSGGFGSTDKK